ncbi:spliced leader 30 kDa protein [Ditylenchus destructor]|uniref:Spliced leader 30 kDa protein n=1 Tax=Ditylenchus destructor TaxID=166010 RepID=A0AAD4MXN9_9BILA|nr:spliced leader 30 kDa protein [Ditylenchus destructor]
MANAATTLTEVRANIANLERDYTAHKEKFEAWKVENAALAGHHSYDKYVQQFVDWEKGVLEQLQDMRKTVGISQMPRSASASAMDQYPQHSPMVDLDTQLNEALTKIKPADFMMAIFMMAQRDTAFLPKVFEVIKRETRGTGFSNPVLPQHTSSSYAHLPPAPSLHSYSMPPPSLQGVSSTYNLVSGPKSAPSAATAPPTVRYTQVTPYGAIPEGWAIRPAIHKQQNPPQPERVYTNPLPFKDYSQGSSLL